MYHDVLLSQQMIPAIKPDTGDTIIFQQDNVPATAPVRPRSCCNSRPTTSLATNIPDLNPVDYKIWRLCNRGIRDINELKQRLTEVWSELQ